MKKGTLFYSGCVLLAGTLWGFTGVFVRWMSALGLTVMQQSICRSAATVGLLLIFLLITDRQKLKAHLRDLPLFALIGLCAAVAVNYCYFNAIMELNSMAAAAVLMYTSPVFVMLMSAAVFHEKITRFKVMAVVCTLLGCTLVTGVFGSSVQVSALGIALGLGSGITYGLYSILAKFALKNYHPMTVTFYMWLFGLLFSLPFGDPVGLAVHVAAQPAELWGFLLFGLVSAALPYTVYNIGLRHTPASKAGVMSAVEPCVAAVIGVCAFGETLTLSLVAGILLVMASVVLLNVPKIVPSTDTQKDE